MFKCIKKEIKFTKEGISNLFQKTITQINFSQFNHNNFEILNKSNFFTFNKYYFSKRGSKEWMDRHVKDHYVKKTKLHEYRSRAAFKLLEIHEKYKLLRPGQKVLDVGSAPGGWSQIIADYTKSSERNPNIVAVDLLPMEPIPGVYFIQGNMNKQDVHDKILEKNNYEKFDLVLSDMCPEFTGTKGTDHVNLIELNKITIDFASKVLKRNGNFVMKTFEGTLQKKLQDGIKKYFNKIHRFKPASSRSDSSELFLVCIGYLENEELRKEAEEVAALSPEEYYEKQKDAAIRQYRLAKLNELTLLEDLDKMKDEIIKKFKIDPDKLKVDEKEEQELKKIIDEENEQVRRELYGRAYKPIPKNKTISEFVQDYEKEMEEINKKLKDILQKEKIEIEEYEEFFKADIDKQHQDEIEQERIKELQFLQENIHAIEKSIKDEEAQDLLRPDGNENETLAKYRRWEQILKDLENEMEQRRKSNRSDEVSGDRIGEDLQNEENSFFKGVQNLKKKITKTRNIKEKNLPEESDVFFNKKSKKEKSNKDE